jgi:hypothetical protein
MPKISELNNASPLTGAEKFPIVQGGSTKGATPEQVRDFIGGQQGQLQAVFDGGGSALEAGKQAALRVPYDCTIQKWEVVADQSGDLQVDVWRDTFANYPPTVDDSITAAAPISLSGASKGEDDTLTGWTVELNKGDYLVFNVDSAATITRVDVILPIVRRFA